MVIEWKERDHDEVDQATMLNQASMDAMRNCGILIFFMTPRKRAQPDLLQHLVSILDTDQEVFILGDQDGKSKWHASTSSLASHIEGHKHGCRETESWVRVWICSLEEHVAKQNGPQVVKYP